MVKIQDRRLTITKQARSEIFQRGGYRAKERKVEYSISACLILESWFENGACEVILKINKFPFLLSVLGHLVIACHRK